MNRKIYKFLNKYKFIFILILIFIFLITFIQIREGFQTSRNSTIIYSRLTNAWLPYEYIAPRYNSSNYPMPPTNFSSTSNINVNSAVLKYNVEQDFISYSFETPEAVMFFSDMYGNTRPSFSNIIKTFYTIKNNTLGPNFRIGASFGNVRYDPSNTLYQTIFNTYKNIINSVNGTLTFQIPITRSIKDGSGETFVLDSNDSIYASNVANYLKNTVGFGNKLTIQIGNEPDWSYLYGKKVIGVESNVYNDFITTLNSYITILNPIVGSNILIGSFTRINNWTRSLSSNISRYTNKVKFFSVHYYDSCDCGKGDNPKYTSSFVSKNDITPAQLLNRTYLIPTDLISTINSANIEYHIGETNSICCGGKFGVSDTFASALWAIDYALFCKLNNIKRINFHNHIIPNGVYSLFQYPDTYREILTPRINVKPIAHGILVLNYILRNNNSKIYNLNRSFTPNGNSTLRTWVIKNDSEWNIVFLHMNPNVENIRIQMNKLTNNSKSAKLYRLVCQTNISAKNGISFAGLTFEGTTDGNLVNCKTNASVPFSQLNSYLNNSSNYETVNIISDKYTFIIGKTSAVVLTIPL